MDNELFISWAKELQSIAQAGLFYGKDVFDKERYEKIRDISAQMMSKISDLKVEKVKELFCNEIGYQTPKIDTRAAIFKDDKILLVHEKNGTWSLPGGWCDYNISVAENTIKETKEEAGLDVVVKKLIAVQDRAKHNSPLYPYGVCKIFVECSLKGGQFENNVETTETAYFSEDEFPKLALEKNNEEQLKLCFKAHFDEKWVAIVEQGSENFTFKIQKWGATRIL